MRGLPASPSRNAEAMAAVSTASTVPIQAALFKSPPSTQPGGEKGGDLVRHRRFRARAQGLLAFARDEHCARLVCAERIGSSVGDDRIHALLCELGAASRDQALPGLRLHGEPEQER